MKSLKITLLFILALQSYKLKAQYNQGFEPVSGTTSTIITILRNQCWTITGLSVNAGGTAPITGTQTFVSGASGNISTRGFITPYMTFDGTDSVALNYKYYGTPGNFQRWFLLKLISDIGQITTIDSIFINTSSNNTINFNKKINGFVGKFKIFINYQGSGTAINGSRTGFDDFFFSGNYAYATGCVDTDIDGVIDTRDVDDDNDGISDAVEVCGIGSTSFACLGSTPVTSDPGRDADNDGVVNFLDPQFCILNVNGVCTNLDFDGDGIPNHMDLDSDNDGILDAIEANNGTAPLNYLNGIINAPVGPNGMPNSAETSTNTGISNFPIPNSDSQGNPDYLDIDADNDGIVDNIEAQGTFTATAAAGTDNDRDGVDDAFDGQAGLFATGLTPLNTDLIDNSDYIDSDSDNDGRFDIIEAYDNNGNSIQDGIELSFTASGIDTDNDGLDNNYDLINGANATNGGQTANAFPNAQFGSAEKDWREIAFIAEICNNGLDDDGDGFADCLDSDCGLLVIDSVTVTNAGPCTNVANGSIIVYSMNAINYSIDNGANFSNDSLFVNLAAGFYNVVAQNNNGCTSASINNPIEITSSNCAPIAVDDIYSTSQNTTLNGTSFILNDNSTDGPSLNINTIALTSPSSGLLTINIDGTFIYIPNNGFFGSDQFEYIICDGAFPALCDTGLVIITINQVNQLPIIINESFTTNINTPVSGNILANDTDPDGTLGATTLPIVNPANGIFTTDTTGNFTYTPNNGFFGIDTVVVLVCDNSGACQNDTIFITTSNNIAPTVLNESISTNEDTQVAGNILNNDSDADGTVSVNLTPLQTASNGVILMNLNGDFTYTPDPNFFGTDFAVYIVCDNLNACFNDTIFITVNSINDAPIVVNETYSVNENQNFSDNILINDSDIESSLIVTTIPLVNTINGAISMLANGDFTYTPNANFTGSDTAVFLVCDLDGACANDTIFITVSPITNTPPIIVNDAYNLLENSSVTDNFTLNDSDPDGFLVINLIPVQNVSNGVLTYDDLGQFTYTPNIGFTGVDTAVIQICDNLLSCAFDTLFLKVIPMGIVLNVNNDFFTMNENAILLGNILANDFSNQGVLIAFLIGGTSNGVVTVNFNGQFVYTPNLNFVGLDTVFTSVCDVNSLCINDTIFITVLPVVDPFVINNEQYVVPFNSPFSDNLLSNDVDLNGILSANLPQIVGPSNGLIVINTNGSFTYTPNNGFFGLDTVVVEVCSSSGPCENDTLFFSIDNFNNPPIINNETYNTTINVSITDNLLTNDSDIEGPLTANIIPIYGPINGNIIVSANGGFTYTPNFNFSGLDTVVISVCDNDNFCINDTIFITIPAGNTFPVVENETFNATQDQIFVGNILTNDFDLETGLTVNTTPIVDLANGLIFMFANGSFSYAPNAGFVGNDFAVFSVCDLDGACVNDTVFFIVSPIANIPPDVFNDFYSVIVNGTISNNLMLNDSDLDGTISTTTTPIVNPSNGVFTVQLNGDFTYTPNPGFIGNDTVVVQVCDNSLACVNDTLFFNVTGIVNLVVVNDTITILEDNNALGNIILNDSDPDGPVTASLVIVLNPAHGTINIDATGNYGYAPNGNYNGSDTIVFSVCDTDNNCINDTLFVTILAVNDAIIVVNETLTTNENTPFSGNIIGNDADPDGTLINVNTIAIVLPTNGNAIINSNGTFDYVPNAGFIGTDTIVVNVCDSGLPLPASCLNDTIFITVIDINNPPTVFNENVITDEDNAITSTVITADVDPDGTTLNANTLPLSGPMHGTIVINTNGDFTYTPNNNYNGSDTIVVQICDNGLPLPAACSMDTIFITINPINDAPAVINDTASTLSNQTATGNILLNDVDIENTLLSADTININGPSNGTIVLNTNGNFVYTPNTGFYGQDTIIVNVCDSGIPLPISCTADTLIITINPIPAIANAGVDQTICSDTLTLNGNSTPVGNGLWTVISGTAIFADSSLFNTTVSGLTIGQNILQWSISSSNGSTLDTVLITVNPPLQQPNAGTDQTICGFTDSLNAIVPAIGTGVWSISGGSGVITDPNLFNSEITNLGIGNNVFVWTVSDGICPPVSDNVIINVNPPPTNAAAGIDVQICGTSIQLSANAPIIGIAYWTKINPSSTIADTLNAQAVASNLSPGANQFVWNIKNGVCPTNTDTVEIFTFQNSTSPVAGNDTTICVNQLNLNANTVDIGIGQWGIVNSTGTFTDFNLNNTQITNLNDGENILIWTSVNGVCPILSDTIIIQLQACTDTSVFIPAGFSPNGDGVNDVLIISGTKGANVNIQIFNRWGSKVFESNNYQNGWGGTNEDSKELLDATYYYIIKVDGEEKARTGYLTIWR